MFAGEYRDGSPDKHFRHQTINLDVVADVFHSFARGEHEWKQRYPWQLYPL